MHYNHVLHYLQNKELNELYFCIALRSCAIAMLSIFVPIYLLKLNYTLSQIFIFYTIICAVHALGTIPVAYFAGRFGLKHTILYSFPFLITFMVLLYTLESMHWNIYALSLIYGINNAFFWFGYHTDFCVASKPGKLGEGVGMAFTLMNIATVTGPLLGGLIISLLNYQSLFSIVCSILIIAPILLFRSKEVHKPVKLSFTRMIKENNMKDIISMSGYGIESSVNQIMWPIFVYTTILVSAATLGSLGSLFLFCSLITTIVIGKYSNHSNRSILKLGSLVTTGIWVLRTFVTTVTQVFYLEFFYGITKTTMYIPFNSICYEKANQKDIFEYIILRELWVNGAAGAIFLAAAFFTTLEPNFWIAAIASLMHMLF